MTSGEPVDPRHCPACQVVVELVEHRERTAVGWSVRRGTLNFAIVLARRACPAYAGVAPGRGERSLANESPSGSTACDDHDDAHEHVQAEQGQDDRHLGEAQPADDIERHAAAGAPGAVTPRRDVLLLAYDVLEAGLAAATVEDAIAAMRPELEVRSREDLVRVAMALVGEPAWFMQDSLDRARLLERVRVRRLKAMWADESAVNEQQAGES